MRRDLMGWFLAIVYWLCGIFFFRNSIVTADGTPAVAWYVVLAFFWPIFLVIRIIIAVVIFINIKRGRL